MRLRLSIRRHGLPAVKLLWRVPRDCTTIAKLLEHVSEVIPLESDAWDFEDYVVQVGGYECLHYQKISDVLKDEDKVSIRALETSEVRARTVSGRYQITAGGAKLIDGIAYGRSHIKQISRPHVHIPPRKRPRLMSDELYTSEEGEDESEGDSSQILRIEAPRDFDGYYDADVKDAAGISSALVSHKKRKRSAEPKRRVSFDKTATGYVVSAGNFDVYEDEDSDADSDFTPEDDTSASESSESESESESESGSDSNAENRKPLKRIIGNDPSKIYTVSPSTTASSTSSSSLFSSSVSSDIESSTISSDSSSESDTLNSSDDEKDFKGPATKHRAASSTRINETSIEAGDKDIVITPRTKAIDKIETEKPTESVVAKQNNPKPVPPGQGKLSTKQRNDRRKRAKAFQRQNAGMEPSETPAGTNSADAKGSIAQDKASFEIRRQNLLDMIANHGVDIETDLSKRDADRVDAIDLPIKSNHNKSSHTPSSKHPETQETPVFSTPDDIDDQPQAKKARTRLDLASTRRLLFGSLGVTTPKTKEDEDKLREQFRNAEKPQPSKTATSLNNGGINSVEEVAFAQATEVSDMWKDKIRLTAVECVDDHVNLSTPPFPFVQRWDPQQKNYFHNEGNSRGKKRKRKQGNAHVVVEPEWSNEILDYEGAGVEKEQQGADDLPELPEDTSTVPALSLEDVKEGAVIAFKKLEVSEDTNWQPGQSPYRTAVVEKVDEVDHLVRVCVRLAQRDRPSYKAKYDEEGNRIYGKFEVPTFDEDDSGEEADDAEMEVMFGEMVEAKLLVPSAPVASLNEPVPGERVVETAAQDAGKEGHDNGVQKEEISEKSKDKMNKKTKSKKKKKNKKKQRTEELVEGARNHASRESSSSAHTGSVNLDAESSASGGLGGADDDVAADGSAAARSVLNQARNTPLPPSSPIDNSVSTGAGGRAAVATTAIAAT